MQINSKYLLPAINGSRIAVISNTALIVDEIARNEYLSNISPQNRRPIPLKMAPQLPIIVKKESSSIVSIPYYL